MARFTDGKLAGIDQRKPRPGDFTILNFWTHRNRNKTKKPQRVLTTEPLADIFRAHRTSYYVYRSVAGKVFIRHEPMDVSKASPGIKYMGRSSVGSAKQVLHEAKERFGHMTAV